MRSTLILTGDVNLMGVEDPAVPFRRVAVKWTRVVKQIGLVAD